MDGEATITLAGDDPAAVQLVLAIQSGDTAAVGRLLADEPRLAQARITARGGTRTPLHVVTDWPGYFPEGPQMAMLLIEAGADLDAVTTPDPGETPLHWAASSDDADVAAVLIDGGADIEKPGGSIGTPLDNAIGYSCWHVARLLAARGARVEKLWHAAALGMLTRLEELLAQGHDGPEDVSQAFWHACAASQRRAREPGRRTSSPGCASWVPRQPRPSTKPWLQGRFPDADLDHRAVGRGRCVVADQAGELLDRRNQVAACRDRHGLDLFEPGRVEFAGGDPHHSSLGQLGSGHGVLRGSKLYYV
jgi:uncharacterized protein